MSVTHQEIADRLGLSRTIVTQALNGTRSSRVGAETRREVMKVARQLGYQPRNRTTHNIGFVCSLSGMVGESGGMFMAQIEAALSKRGYRLLVVSIDKPADKKFSDILNAKTVDGVIISEWHDGTIRAGLPSKMPFVVVSDEYGIGDDVDIIAVDPVTTMQRIVEYLISCGHSRLALITGVVDIKFYHSICSGVQKAVDSCDLSGVKLEIVKGQFMDVPNQIAELMRSKPAPTALIIDDLWRATPALYALKSAGYRIPEDVSVVSYADSFQFAAMQPSVTVTNQFRDELAQKAVERLLHKIHVPETTPTKTLISGNIVERQSVASPPGSPLTNTA